MGSTGCRGQVEFSDILNNAGWRSLELGLFLWQITDVVASRMAELDAAFGQRMAQTPSGRAWALAFYEQARPRYDPNTQQHVDRILGVQGSALAEAA